MDVKQRNGIIFDFFLKTSIKIRPNIGKKIKSGNIESTLESDETNVEINILSPEEWLTIWEKRLTVSGTSRKNHKVSLLINWSEEIITNTNSNELNSIQIFTDEPGF